MTAKILLALICQVAFASECSSEDSQCDANVLLQSQKKVEAHSSLNTRPTIKTTFDYASFENNVGLTVLIKNGSAVVDTGTLMVFVDKELQGVQSTSTLFPPGPVGPTSKKLYDVMGYGHGDDDNKPMTFAFLDEHDHLRTLKPTSGLDTVFKANARGCELQDGAVKQCSHIAPVELELVRECSDDDAPAERMQNFMEKHFGIGYKFITCAQMLAYNACSHVLGVCDGTCPCPP